MEGHSEIGASSMKRWQACPGSVRLSRGIERKGNAYAAEGTVAHELAEYRLRDKPLAEGRYTGEMAAAVDVYVEHVRSLIKTGCVYDFEVGFHINGIHDMLWGTADAVVLNPKTATLHVVDYKHGAGVAVEAVDNPQLLYYAVGAAMDPRFVGNPVGKITMTIVQPRCPHEEGPIRSWEIDVMDLVDWTATLKEAVAATEKDDAPLATGDHCRWCPAAAICPEAKRKTLESAKSEFTAGEWYDPAELAATLMDLPRIEAWIKSVREFAYSEAESGRKPTGFKLVDKRADRKWTDEQQAADALRIYGMDDADIFAVPKIKSPAAIEKVVGKGEMAAFAELIKKESSGHTLAPMDDKRPEVVIATAADEFSVA